MSIATQKITAWNPAGTPTESCSQAKAPWAMTWATHFAACSVPSSATSSCCNLAGQEQSQCQASQDTTLVYSYSNQVDIVEWMMLNGSANQLTSASGFLIFTLDVHTKFIPLRKTRFRGNASFQSRTLPAGRRFQSPRRSHFLGCTSSLCVINIKKNHISFWDNDARKKKKTKLVGEVGKMFAKRNRGASRQPTWHPETEAFSQLLSPERRRLVNYPERYQLHVW